LLSKRKGADRLFLKPKKDFSKTEAHRYYQKAPAHKEKSLMV